MNKILAWTTWILLTGCLVVPAHAASDTAPVDTQPPQQSGAGTNDQGTPTTPAAALTWQQRQKARSENKKRAEILREQQIQKEEANKVAPEDVAPQTAK